MQPPGNHVHYLSSTLGPIAHPSKSLKITYMSVSIFLLLIALRREIETSSNIHTDDMVPYSVEREYAAHFTCMVARDQERSDLPVRKVELHALRSICMAGQRKALVACCECGQRQTLVRLLGQAGLNPVIGTSSSHAVSLLRSEAVAIAFCQDDLSGGGYKAVLEVAEQIAVPVVVCSRLADPKRYLVSMELGALDFICPPYGHAEVTALASAVLRACPSRARDPTGPASRATT